MSRLICVIGHTRTAERSHQASAPTVPPSALSGSIDSLSPGRIYGTTSLDTGTNWRRLVPPPHFPTLWLAGSLATALSAASALLLARVASLAAALHSASALRLARVASLAAASGWASASRFARAVSLAAACSLIQGEFLHHGLQRRFAPSEPIEGVLWRSTVKEPAQNRVIVRGPQVRTGTPCTMWSCTGSPFTIGMDAAQWSRTPCVRRERGAAYARRGPVWHGVERSLRNRITQ